MKIRIARPDERPMVRRHWVRALAGNGRESGLLPIGRGQAHAPFLRASISRIVDHLLDTCHVAVATTGRGEGGDEPLGWVAWNGDRLHFVYVLGPVRRRGIGSRLLERVVPANATPTFMTKLGETLISSIVSGYQERNEEDEHERT